MKRVVPMVTLVVLALGLRGLSLDTTYFVRACGQDVNDAQQSYRGIIAFRTPQGNSSALVDGSTLLVFADAVDPVTSSAGDCGLVNR